MTETGKTYYVSALSGCDTNDGSREKPMRTLRAAGRLALRPGDALLLERGSVFYGEFLHLTERRGTADRPILVGSYGEGARPCIAAEGAGVWYQSYGTALDNPHHRWRGYVSSAVLLYDCEYIRLQDLEITNAAAAPGESESQADRMSRTGVAVVARNRGTLHGIELSSLHVHDVAGNVYDKHLNNGGIYCTALKPEKPDGETARYDGLWIHHCRVERCSRWGIAAGYTYTHPFFQGREIEAQTAARYGHTDVVLEYNVVRDIGGDGITPMYCLRPLVQYNVAENTATQINDRVYTLAGERLGKTAAAIWPWKCKDALLQYNEAYHTCLNQDGQAWDADSGDGTVYQYNYSHGNGGGCVMFCEGESVNNVFRYNISMLDGGGVINPAHNPDAHLYGNIFILAEGVPFIRDNMSGGGMLVEGNLIYNSGQKPVSGDWHHQTNRAVYRRNLYCNFADTPEEDTEAIVKEAGEALLADPLGGPRQADGEAHDGKRFACFAPAAGKKEEIDRILFAVRREGGEQGQTETEPRWEIFREKEARR